MYKIYADEILIYDDMSSDSFYKVASPHLTLEKGAPGSLKMTIPPGTAGYDVIVRMATNIRVEKDGQELWAGRAIQESKDFLNQRQITCEGELAYFNDTTQLPQTYDYTGSSAFLEFLEAILALHNTHTTDDRRIFIKDPDPQSPTYNHVISIIRQDVPSGGLHITTGYENTLTYLSKMVNEFGGYFRIRKVKGIRYLDYVDNSTANTTAQTIEFGKNLMDFTKSYDSTDFATVVIPLGAKQESGEGEETENYLTVKDQSPSDSWHSSPKNEIYVANTGDGTSEHPDLVSMYGWIEKVVHWDEETDAPQLMKRAEAYLDSFQFETMVLEVSALDLHYLNPEIQDIGIGELVYVRSAPHGLNKLFPVNKLDIPLDQPQNTIFQLGAEEKVSLTATNKKDNTQLMQAIDEALNKDEILEDAKAQASALMNQNLNGYVTIMTIPNDPEHPDDGSHSEAIYISDTIPLEKNPEGSIHPYNVQRFWKWGLSGLGYTDDWGENFKTAITMDGSILGERIAAGSIHGSKITAGSLDIVTSSGESGLSIGLESRGLTPGSFGIGDIDQNNGKNIDSTTAARMSYKIYLESGIIVKIMNSTYQFEVFQYSNNNDIESGFVRKENGTYFNNTPFTVSISNYYRLVVSKREGGTIDQNELSAIVSAFEISGSQAVIHASDLKVIGMVTFASLGETDPTSPDYDERTIINGGFIKTGYVTGDRIDAKKLTVSKDNGQGGSITTFAVSAGGDVTIGGRASIIFSDGTTSRLDSIGGEEIAKQIAAGTYTGGTFINERTIYAPDAIISNALIAQGRPAEEDEFGETVRPADESGSFILKNGNGVERFRIEYFGSDIGPQIQFNAQEPQGTPASTPSTFRFNRRIIAPKGIYAGDTDEVSDFFGTVNMNATLSFGLHSSIILYSGVNYFSSYAALSGVTPVEGQIAFVLA